MFVLTKRGIEKRGGMTRKKHTLFLIILFALSACLIFTGGRGGTVIDEPYHYPVTPGTPEWAALSSREEMTEALQIPDDMLSRLSTPALVQTILEYPLISEMTIFYRDEAECTAEAGFWRIADTFNGLQELLTRKDALPVLEERYGGKFQNLSRNVVPVIIYRNVARYQSGVLSSFLT